MNQAVIGLLSAIIGGGFTITGTLVGFRASESARQRRDELAQKRQIHSFRVLLALEIEKDLALLRDYWSSVQRLSGGPSLGAGLMQARAEMADIPLPQWQRRVWDSQTTFIPVALTVDEMRQTYQHYTGLEGLTAMDDNMRFMRRNYLPAQFEQSFMPDYLGRLRPLVESILADGNPLPSPNKPG